MEVRDMKPGRELDELIDKKIFERQSYKAPYLKWPGRYVYKVFWDDPNSYYDEWHRSQEIGEWEYCGPSYSTDISAAWEVVEKMNCPYIIASTEDGDQSWVHFGNEANAAIGEAAHAICIAALLAMEDKA